MYKQMPSRVGSVLQLRLLWGILTLLLLLLIQPATLRAADGASIVISPSTRFILQGNTGTVDVLVNDYNDPNGVGLYGADVRLTFDKNIVTVASVTPGPLLASGGYFTVPPYFDNTAGTVTFIISQLNPTPPRTCPTPPTACSGVLFSVTFNGNTVGTSPVNVTVQAGPPQTPKLSNLNGSAIPVTSTSNGAVNVYVPTAATVLDFRGEPDGANQARLEWQTGTELGLLGFNLWRSDNPAAGFTKRNPALISAKNPGQVSANAYAFEDTGLAAQTQYDYKLEAVKTDGSSEWVGPISLQSTAVCTGSPDKTMLLSPANRAMTGAHLTLDWADAGCALAYRLQVRQDSSRGIRLLNDKVAASQRTLTLKAGHTYFWRVRTIGAYGRSAWSEWRSFRVSAP